MMTTFSFLGELSLNIPYIVNTYTNNQNNSNYLYVYYFLIYMLTLFFIDHLRIFFQKSHSHLFSHSYLITRVISCCIHAWKNRDYGRKR